MSAYLIRISVTPRVPQEIWIVGLVLIESLLTESMIIRVGVMEGHSQLEDTEVPLLLLQPIATIACTAICIPYYCT